MYELWMLEHDRIPISEGNDASKKCDICPYWYFKDIGFKYEPYLCNGCHDLMQEAISFNDVASVYVKRSVYRIHFWYMSKDDAISRMNNFNLIEFCNFFLLCIKNDWVQLRWKNLVSKEQRCDTK